VPTALLSQPLKASIVIGSFGSSKPLKSQLFSVTVANESSNKTPEPAARYGQLPEIHHIFRDDAKSPPKILSLVFTFAVLACLPAVLVAWAVLGGNLNHLPKALGAAPISHTLFFGSIVGMEGVFYMYYTTWRLFTVLPVAGLVALVAFVSGSRALTEVQERRLKGER
jgi:oligosaccharyltransferase complex subunit delta (ribophorin II)